jgi:murein DD-endopeptidase MepM/ murein hydrolase activator NlpD
MKFSFSKKPLISLVLKRLMTSSVLFITALSPIFALSTTAHAGLLSFMSSMVGGQEASAKIESKPPLHTSQNIALLQAAVNTDPNPHKASNIPPVEDNVLVADLAVEATGGPDDTNTQISIYTVRAGDNLSTIADMFDVSVSTIMWANDISKASSIQPGQTLIILPVSGINYTIQKGDTIRGIVAKYKADLDEVLNYNGISLDTTLVVGQSIIIPDAEMQAVVPTRTVAGTKSAPNYAGYYMRPISGGSRSQGVHGYNAVDLAAPVGTAIYASAGGRVIASVSNGGWNGGYGNYVIISHANGTQTLYAHNSKNFVKLGQEVTKGDKIAAIGMTGKTTGPHVHFEIRGAKNPF